MTGQPIEYRLAQPSETGELALVMQRAFSQRDNEPLPTAVNVEALEGLQEREKRIKAQTYVAAHGDKIVGFALSHPLIETKLGYIEHGSDTEHIALLAIEPDYWGQRIASKLLELTMEHARASGRSRLTLWTREADNSRAQAVYEHKGFTLTGDEKPGMHGKQIQYQLRLL